MQMAKDAKKATKLEKKLKILFGGYIARCQVLSKQLQDTHEQVEQALLELSTFKGLCALECGAITARLEAQKESVHHKTEKENCLQQRYSSLMKETNNKNA
jgi:pre-mRNA-splicing factor CDC5/CEF1